MQACVWEQRTLSVPKKQPGGDFHLIGPHATAACRPQSGVWREPRDGALHGSTERSLCYDDYRVLSPMGLQHPSVLSQRSGNIDQESGKEGEKKGRVKEDDLREYKETHAKLEGKHIMFTSLKGNGNEAKSTVHYGVKQKSLPGVLKRRVIILNGCVFLATEGCLRCTFRICYRPT